MKTINNNFQTQVCDFWDDCSEGEDEKSCPKTYLFEDCQEEPPPGCGWVEQPEDELDWIIAAGIVILIYPKKIAATFFHSAQSARKFKKSPGQKNCEIK